MQRSVIARWVMWALLFSASFAAATPPPPQASNSTRSPHGSLNIACQNCHTVYGWKPIRAVPEFDHNQTKFPLRGLHENVNCVNCHTKMVFTNVGKKCADCHADIHRGKMAAACENCHTVRGWNVSVGQVNMHMNRFPLTGAHAAAACEDCHKNAGLSQFTGLSTDCISCHAADFNGTTNPKHTAATYFSTTPCQNCHSADTWANAKFDHSVTGFILTGSHSVPPRTCADCHKNNNFNLSAADTACVTCHQADYNSTTNPNHSSQPQLFPATCQNCHTTVAWQPATFDHSTTSFPLTGAHTVPPRACTDCHVNNNYNITATTCVSCHLTDFNKTTNPNHVQGGFPQTCDSCHTTTAWSPASFDHSKTAFPLTGAHTVPPRQCTDCHINNNYNLTNTTCVSCHQTDYNNAVSPVNHVAANFPTACANCHDTVVWTDGKFDHSSTGFALTGAHTVPPRTCTDCHINGNYNITVTTCVSCHQTDYTNALSPVNHVAANFPTTCENCHDTVLWTDGKFDHSSTGWTLTGAHTVPPRACSDCHLNGNYNITVTTCVSCHQTDYNNALSPVNHVTANFPTTCENCHDMVLWTDGKFDHSSTGWTLTGSHTVPPRACTDCHVNNNYNITVTTCVSCHQTDYNNAKTPVDHIAAKFPTTCDGCHDTIQWSDGVFNHATTGWTLTGAHTVPPRACADCHVNGNYSLSSTACVTCHQTDFNNALSPVNHPASGFPITCDGCHDTIQWTDGKFDHSVTGWTLTGSHTVPPRACTDCHVNNNYSISVTTCVSCHQTDYNNALSPVNHVAANFPTTCANCHDTVLWTDGKFDHSSTGWTLTGSHTVPPRACTDCHLNGNYNITVTTCVSCHQTDYNNTNNPSHAQQGIGTTCETCHTTTAWSPAQFDHSQSGFPLTGAHTVPPRACTDCHINNNYNITNTACVSCHQTDYNNATTPVNHVAANFPTTCATCHDTVQWTDGKFDHSTTGWVLTGSHTVPPRACTDCHINGNYNITVTTCVSCHQTDYNNALTPVNHPASGFPTTCDTCHDTIQWTDGKFDHSTTGWALSGAHTVPPRACIDCHVNNNYNITVTTCVSCHQTDYNNAKTPVDHIAAKFPTTCDGCHDTIQWSDGVFNHATTGWTLTGAHTVPPRACTDCHINGNYNITVTTCVSCHQTDYNNALTPVNHPQAGFPTTCDSCHDMIQWSDGKFDHSTTGWTLTGSHTVPPRACTDCHVNNNYSLSSTTCVTCHQTDYNNATTPVNHVAANFPTACANCHDTVQWTDGVFDHSSTGWALTGSHTVPPRACTDCHVNGNYNITVSTCVSCHQTDYNNALTPVNHPQANFPTTCDTCHDTIQWTDAKFDHSTTGWALTGSHTVPPRACTDCHVGNNYSLSSTTCVTCHQTDYNNATTPVNHVAAKFPTTCDGCHDTVQWTDGVFDHSTTGWTLTGSHTVPPRACTDCHVNGNYNITVTTCVSCHQTDYNNALTPVNHPQAGFPTTCDTCHDTIQWTDGKFDHSTTGWALSGAHTVPPRACTDCHVNNNYSLSSTTCVTCHQTDYNNAVSPVNHVAAKFPTTCDGCHDTIQWSDGVFNHATTGWTLTGSHTVPPRACTDCHVNNNYNITVTTCVSCHQNDYNTATTPVNHITASFPTTCDTCHDTIQWTDGKFDHSTTGWALTGSHTVPPRACTDCHVNNNYNLTSATCLNCHQTDYNNTTMPPHAAVSFPTTCDACHDTIAWTDATFDHSKTAFPLAGAHTVPPRTCTDCHVANNYLTLPTDCYGCHATDYNNTTNPNHKSAGFPTTCLTCHTTWVTTNWLGAVFNHTWFPMTHGNANGVCATCHTNPSDYSVFQCTNCHTKSNTDSNHTGVSGYVYNSINCYQCHHL